MKKIIFLALSITCFFYTATAQKHTIDFSSGTLRIEGYDNLIIEGYDGNEVLIYTDVVAQKENKINTETERSEREPNNTSEDPEDPELTYEIQGKELQIISKESFDVYRLKVPRSLNVVCKTSNNYYSKCQDKNIEISEITGEIELSALDNVNVMLENVSGAISIVTYGNITAAFNKITTKGSLHFDTYRGFVDLTLPEDAALRVKLNSKKGKVYSDLPVKKDKEENESGKLRGLIGAGGIDLIVNTEDGGDIFLRKGNLIP